MVSQHLRFNCPITGREAKPCYPLTPAAVISACGGSKEERERARQVSALTKLFFNSSLLLRKIDQAATSIKEDKLLMNQRRMITVLG